MKLSLEKTFKNILKTIGFWVAIPSIIGLIVNHFWDYNTVYVIIISAIILWGINTEVRIQDLKKTVFGGKKNGKK